MGDAFVAVGTVPPDTRFRRHAHEGPHLCGVLAGGFVERTGRSRESAGRDTVRFSPAAVHDIDFGHAGARCVVITLDALPEGVVLDRSCFLADPWLGGLIGRIEPLLATGAIAAGAALEHSIAELLAQLLRRRQAGAARVPPSWLRGIRESLVDRRSEMPTLAAMAGEIGVHRAHLARAFRDHYGVTIGAFVRRLRVEHALELMHDGDRTLVELALEAGFSDQSHMTRAFAAALGTTPGRLRRELAGTRRLPRLPWPASTRRA